jgi:hypothetical protein
MARMGEKKKANVIGDKVGGKKTIRRPRRRWFYNIKMDLGEIGFWEGVVE